MTRGSSAGVPACRSTDDRTGQVASTIPLGRVRGHGIAWRCVQSWPGLPSVRPTCAWPVHDLSGMTDGMRGVQLKDLLFLMVPRTAGPPLTSLRRSMNRIGTEDPTHRREPDDMRGESNAPDVGSGEGHRRVHL